jgi:predicted amidohydrolase
MIALALLHLAPQPGEIERNKRMVEEAAVRASAMGAKVIVTPELVVSGYGFRDVIGTDWIARDQAALFDWAGKLARQASAFLLLGHARGPACRREAVQQRDPFFA